MSVYKCRWFSDPEMIRKIEPDLMVELLRRHESFFEERGLELPKNGTKNEIDYETLVKILANPEEGVPDELTHAMYFIGELSTPNAMDELREEARLHRIELVRRTDASPIDVAIQVWLEAPQVLERKHAEVSVSRKRTYSYYQAVVKKEKGRRPKRTTKSMVRALELRLGEWFQEHDRGDGCRIRVSTAGSEWWFLIWHGQTLHRQGTVKDGRSSSVVFRPERYDVVVYNSTVGEIRIKADSARETGLYRETFGEVMFEDRDYFPGEGKYTLEPLRTRGPKALVCRDIEGIARVRLKELRFMSNGLHQEVETHQAPDLFASFRDRDFTIPEDVRLTLAKFDVWFEGRRTPRTVTVRPPNASSYTRDEDSVPVEEWLRRRGFVRRNDHSTR